MWSFRNLTAQIADWFCLPIVKIQWANHPTIHDDDSYVRIYLHQSPSFIMYLASRSDFIISGSITVPRNFEDFLKRTKFIQILFWTAFLNFPRASKKMSPIASMYHANPFCIKILILKWCFHFVSLVVYKITASLIRMRSTFILRGLIFC